VVVAGNAEQVPDAGLFETAKQEVTDLHSSAGAAGHCFASLDSIDEMTETARRPLYCSHQWVTREDGRRGRERTFLKPPSTPTPPGQSQQEAHSWKTPRLAMLSVGLDLC